MSRCITIVLLGLSLSAVPACEEDPTAGALKDGTRDPDNGGTDGNTNNDPNQVQDDKGCESLLKAIIRDFPQSHPDFYHDGSSTETTGMVNAYLDGDKKPVSASGEMYSTNLDEWYRTIDGVNKEFSTFIQLTEDAEGKWVFDSTAFFPLSAQTGYGADIPGQVENFLFTTELSLEFIYQPGQTFKFRGDDDLWVFINDKLAIDVGGIHSPVEKEVNIELFSNQNGFFFQPGQKVPMHIFHAERNPVLSNFRIETTIGCFNAVVI